MSRTPSIAMPHWSARRIAVKPLVLLQVSLLLLAVANIGKVPALDLGDRDAALFVGDFACGAVILAGAMTAMRNRSLRLDSIALTGLLFVAIGALSDLAGVSRFGFTLFELLVSLAYLARWTMYFVLYIVTINYVRDHDVRAVWKTLERAMLVFATFGIVQSIFLPDFAQMVYPDVADTMDYQGHRLVSTVLEPNIAAAMIVIVLLVQLAKMSAGERLVIWKPLLLLTALVLTLSRSGLLALAVGIAVIVAVRGVSKRMLRIGAISLVALLATLPRLLDFASAYNKLGVSDVSATSRFVAWQRALAVLVDYPWFGIGFNTYAFVLERRGFERVGSAAYATEGGLLYIAVMTGMIGLAVFVAMLWLVYRRSSAGWRNAHATPAERGLCVGAVAATAAVLVHSIFVNTITVVFVIQPLVVLWGLVFVSRRRMRAAANGV